MTHLPTPSESRASSPAIRFGLSLLSLIGVALFVQTILEAAQRSAPFFSQPRWASIVSLQLMLASPGAVATCIPRMEANQLPLEANSQRRFVLWCLCCLVAGGVVGYSVRLRADREADYRNLLYAQAIHASGSIASAAEVLALIRASKADEAQTQLREQITQNAVALREHRGEFTAL